MAVDTVVPDSLELPEEMNYLLTWKCPTAVNTTIKGHFFDQHGINPMLDFHGLKGVRSSGIQCMPSFHTEKNHHFKHKDDKAANWSSYRLKDYINLVVKTFTPDSELVDYNHRKIHQNMMKTF
uniref:Uncharacterized protein n=1 Tax=Romanomermis culicivorax TaxID=13658 RepID=A0A915HHA7_ROMCU